MGDADLRKVFKVKPPRPPFTATPVVGPKGKPIRGLWLRPAHGWPGMETEARDPSESRPYGATVIVMDVAIAGGNFPRRVRRG